MWIFKPILKSKIWGGCEILHFKGIKDDNRTDIGESWEVSGLPGSESVVKAGPDMGMSLPQLVHKYGATLLGTRTYQEYPEQFPLLVKIIDAHDDLSVQVHPDNDFAREYGYPNGKTEMWVVLKSTPDATLKNGFKHPVDKKEFLSKVQDGSIMNDLRSVTVHPMDAFFIPAGRVHTIGAGMMVVEVQQTSDLTYRIYDYERQDSNGNKRELHLDKAVEAINFSDCGGYPLRWEKKDEGRSIILPSPLFFTNLVETRVNHCIDYSCLDSFVILMCVGGNATLTDDVSTMTISCGDTVLLPASNRYLDIAPGVNGFSSIEIYIE